MDDTKPIIAFASMDNLKEVEG